MLGRVPKRKGFENVADWIRNEFHSVLQRLNPTFR
eukprot:SAG31_NODE_1272_length_9064_cov_5.201004_9_plen_35_part_00